MSEPLAEEVFREASESIDVLSPSLEDVRRRAREQRGRRWSIVAGAAVAVAAGVTTWWGIRATHPPDAALTVAPTVHAENPADVAWFANGELHLDHVTIDLPALQDLVAIGGGAVYADDDGAVVFVADDGARSRLGSKDQGTPLVGSDEQGWVAWSDTGGREPVLVLYDLTSRQRLRTVAPTDPAHESATELVPIAIDQDLLYYRSGSQSYAVAPRGAPEEIGAGLLDVSSATRVFQADAESIRMEQSFFSTVTAGLGVGAQLSPHGDFVLTRTADDGTSYGTVRVYDSRSGDELPSGLTSDDVAIAATFGSEETVTYIVARAEDRASADGFVRQSFSGALELRTCLLGEDSCKADTKFPSTGSLPLLAD